MTPPVTVTPLSPCPFCGAKARWVEDHGRFDEPFGLVVDHTEDCFLGNRMMAEWENIITAWNTRIAAETASAARVAELEGLIADAYYVLTYVEASVGDDVTRAACKSVRDGIDAHTTPDADDAGGV